MLWIDRRLITTPVYIGMAFDEKEFHRELKKLKLPLKEWPEFIPEKKDACVHRLETAGEPDVVILCIRPKSKRPLSVIVGLLVHEAAHIWQYIRESLGEARPSSEFEAYSMQQLSQRLVEAYYRKKK